MHKKLHNGPENSRVHPLPSFKTKKLPLAQSQTLFLKFQQLYNFIYTHFVCVCTYVCMFVYSSIQFYHVLISKTSTTIKIQNCTLGTKIYLTSSNHIQHPPFYCVSKTQSTVISISLSFWECYINVIFYLGAFTILGMQNLSLAFFTWHNVHGIHPTCCTLHTSIYFFFAEEYSKTWMCSFSFLFRSK